MWRDEDLCAGPARFSGIGAAAKGACGEDDSTIRERILQRPKDVERVGRGHRDFYDARAMFNERSCDSKTCVHRVFANHGHHSFQLDSLE